MWSESEPLVFHCAETQLTNSTRIDIVYSRTALSCLSTSCTTHYRRAPTLTHFGLPLAGIQNLPYAPCAAWSTVRFTSVSPGHVLEVLRHLQPALAADTGAGNVPTSTSYAALAKAAAERQKQSSGSHKGSCRSSCHYQDAPSSVRRLSSSSRSLLRR